MEPRTFCWALRRLMDGNRVRRKGWNGPGQYVEVQRPTDLSKMTAPYCYLHNTQGDLFADDWEIAG
ncbi:MW1434 family type I TA system toxin [Oceanidesulfovibrio marinus]|uniref:Thoeris anti-defense 2-like domain-containing protein n=1 Tax=Oceanidesulfovibrio marinus TaxID=370038 RepID=A0A6P1ZN16_9BACT|nr:MW1434 family type I TA system toxin [Oceanidesulfovibrio marinus]TVM35648.1 hypothetical protein DQK91_02990 [Oceanidesulfovibrio marinus]